MTNQLKKLQLFVLCCLAAGSAFAQWPFTDNITYYQKGEKENLILKHGIKEMQLQVSKNKKLNPKKTRILQYNEKGLNIFESRPGQKKEFWHNWNEQGLQSSYIYLHKGDSSFMNFYTYNNQGSILSRKGFKGSLNKPQNSSYYTYNDQNKMLSYEEFDKHNKSLYRMEYDYWDGKQIKESKYYRKGKLKTTYTYACSEKGEVEKPKAHETKICTRKTLNSDGSFVEVFESTSKGKLYRTIYTYNADSNLTLYESFDMKGKLKYKTTYTYNSEKKLISYISWNKKGKQRWSYVYAYNNKGMVQQVKAYSKNAQKPKEETNYSYVYF